MFVIVNIPPRIAFTVQSLEGTTCLWRSRLWWRSHTFFFNVSFALSRLWGGDIKCFSLPRWIK